MFRSKKDRPNRWDRLEEIAKSGMANQGNLPDSYGWPNGRDAWPAPSCRRCGAVVNSSDLDLHDAWHASLT